MLAKVLGKAITRLEFELTIQHLRMKENHNPSKELVYVEISRGSKRFVTAKAFVHTGDIRWDDTFVLPVTLFKTFDRETSEPHFDRKEYFISFLEHHSVKLKGPRMLCRCRINIADFATDDGRELSATLPMLDRNGRPVALLAVVLKCRPRDAHVRSGRSDLSMNDDEMAERLAACAAGADGLNGAGGLDGSRPRGSGEDDATSVSSVSTLRSSAPSTCTSAPSAMTARAASRWGKDTDLRASSAGSSGLYAAGSGAAGAGISGPGCRGSEGCEAPSVSSIVLTNGDAAPLDLAQLALLSPRARDRSQLGAEPRALGDEKSAAQLAARSERTGAPQTLADDARVLEYALVSLPHWARYSESGRPLAGLLLAHYCSEVRSARFAASLCDALGEALHRARIDAPELAYHVCCAAVLLALCSADEARLAPSQAAGRRARLHVGGAGGAGAAGKPRAGAQRAQHESAVARGLCVGLRAHLLSCVRLFLRKAHDSLNPLLAPAFLENALPAFGAAPSYGGAGPPQGARGGLSFGVHPQPLLSASAAASRRNSSAQRRQQAQQQAQRDDAFGSAAAAAAEPSATGGGLATPRAAAAAADGASGAGSNGFGNGLNNGPSDGLAASRGRSGQQRVISTLNRAVDLLLSARVPLAVVRLAVGALARFVGASLLNMLLLRPELCSSGNGVQIKLGVSALETWAEHTASRCEASAKERRVSVSAAEILMPGPRSPHAGACHGSRGNGGSGNGGGLLAAGGPWAATLAAFAPIRQAADILIVEKAVLLSAADRRAICPALQPPQIMRLLQSFQADEWTPELPAAAEIDLIAAGLREEAAARAAGGGERSTLRFLQDFDMARYQPSAISEGEDGDAGAGSNGGDADADGDADDDESSADQTDQSGERDLTPSAGRESAPLPHTRRALRVVDAAGGSNSGESRARSLAAQLQRPLQLPSQGVSVNVTRGGSRAQSIGSTTDYETE